MKFRKEFIGLDGFYWWFGVVENRQDPLGLGRCQVRIFGAHTEVLSDIPSDDLPWAHPVHALNNQTFSTPKEGEHVFGFFIDGKFAQSPVMVGIIPGIPHEKQSTSTGFADLRTTEEISTAPKKPDSLNFSSDGSGVKVTEKESFEPLRFPPDDQLGHPTNSNLTRNENIKKTLIQDRRENLTSVEGAFGTSWKEPFPAYATKYPYNKALETESGHIMEFDDTPKAERIHIAHRTGTFEEIYPSGTKVEKIVKNNYQIILCDDHLYVAGKVNITINSHANIKVVGDINLEGNGNLNAGIAGDTNLTIGGDFNIKATNMNVELSDELNAVSGGATKMSSGGSFNAKSGSSVNLSGSGAINLAGSATNSANKLSTGMLDVGSTTNLIATGSDSNGDSHALPINGTDAASPSSAESAKKSGLGDAPETGSPTTAAPFIEQTPADRAAFFVDSGDDPAETAEYVQKQIDAGVYTQQQIDEGKNPTEGESDTTPPPTNITETKDCGGIEKNTDFPNSLQLSKSFTLGALSGQAVMGDPLKDQRGLTKGQIACNLKLLAMNCLDPIKAKYPSMIVTNAFRYPTGAAAGRSQHEIGQAADMQFPSFSKSEYYNIVLWIRDNVPHDQLLLEYKTTGTGMPWIHISFNKEGNRQNSTKNMTFMNHTPYKPYYINLA